METVTEINSPRSIGRNLRDRFTYDRRYQLALTVILTVLCFVTFAPFFWVVLTSIKPNTEIYTTDLQVLPQEPTLEHYRTVFEKRESLPTYVLNTLIYSGVTIAIVAVFASMAGYALGALKIKGAEIFSGTVLIILAVPWIILVVPTLLFEFRTGLYDTRQGLILPYVALFLPFGIWIMRGTFSGLPVELGDAARIDGAGEFNILWQVYLPMAKSGVATTCLILFINIWNEVLFAVTLVTDRRLANISKGIRVLADEGQSFAFGILSAVIVLAMIPTFVVYLMLQRYYVRGVSEGALAGF
jgi:ABC-type glycerol-3-phosphate transport system permease component